MGFLAVLLFFLMLIQLGISLALFRGYQRNRDNQTMRWILALLCAGSTFCAIQWFQWLKDLLSFF